MAKKCVICNENEAEFMVKDTSAFYCQECAETNFGDITLLVKVEDEAKKLQQFIEGSDSLPPE
jgi:hypothetical protein